MECRVCGNEKDNRSYEVKEMMVGNRNLFSYFQCSACQCLQISEFPKNIADYYGAGYYSFKAAPHQNFVKRAVIGLRDRYALFGKSLLGRLLYRKYPKSNLYCLQKLAVEKDTKNLDVGCGSGALLYSMRELGLNNLLGVDPFIERSIDYENGLRIEKGEIASISGGWDIVMFHHSFEHVSDPEVVLSHVHQILNPAGCCVIRVPVASSFAWEHYGVNWVQLDAPRHLFLHSTKSMKVLAGRMGFDIFSVEYDSTALQFWGSEQFARDIPSLDSRSYSQNPKGSIFSKRDLDEFTERAKELNATKRGDQAVFYLRKK